jgi:thiol-disulfide isomerase/thioredoxin
MANVRVFPAILLSIVAAVPASAAGPRESPHISVYIFVRSDCPVSNRYAPEIQQLQAEFAPKGVAFTLVYPDKDETTAQVNQNLHDYGYHLPVERDSDHKLVAAAHATITPEAAVFEGGKLIYHGRIDNLVAAFGKVRPAATTHELQDAIEAALAGRAPAVSYEPAVGCYMSDIQ